MNRRGFTLVELLAMMVVLSVLMVIAVPNISGIIKKNRESISIEDVNKMVRGAKTRFSTRAANYPGNNQCVVLTLNYVDLNDDFKSGVNGGTYDMNESVVIVKKVPKTGVSGVYEYKFYIRLVEHSDSRDYILGPVEYNEYTKNPSSPHYEELAESKKFNFSDDTTMDQAKTTIQNMQSGLCSSVVAIYK